MQQQIITKLFLQEQQAQMTNSNQSTCQQHRQFVGVKVQNDTISDKENTPNVSNGLT